MKETFLLILIMAVTTYLVRMIPFLLVRKKIQNRFIKSLLHYMPYAILSAMTIPAVFYCTGDIRTSLIGFAVGLLLSLKGCSLVVISLSSCAAALASWGIFSYLLH